MRAAIVVIVMVGCGDGVSAIAPGGATTVNDRSSKGLSTPAANLTGADRDRHLLGDAAFEAKFVSAPAPIRPGLGPLFNHNACAACHPGDGRGVPQFGGSGSSALVRVSVAIGTPDLPGAPVPAPGLGGQLQDHGVFGVAPEATVELTWTEHPGNYGDGTAFSLRCPTVVLRRPDGSVIGDDVLRSFRQPPPVFGLGLLEAIPADDILAAADPSDRDGDGISGRANLVWDVSVGATRVGRFGHKASNPTLAQQAGAAYANDMGVTSAAFGGAAEITDDTLDVTGFYTATLAVPARAAGSFVAGEQLFDTLGCASCHTPIQVTGNDGAIVGLREQVFQPYSDLLLHDLGDGLADHRPDYLADGNEWRTPPLWGLGLVSTVLPGASYLHDGRARTIAEAILWHGGEAAPARDRFRTASRDQRAALLGFLQAL
jgi:CxxC motif-containing protein (DUF1111 family)